MNRILAALSPLLSPLLSLPLARVALLPLGASADDRAFYPTGATADQRSPNASRKKSTIARTLPRRAFCGS